MRFFHKKPGLAFWITVLLLVPLAYLLSFGPACWLCHKGYLGVHFVSLTHRPVVWAAWHSPRQVRLLIYRYEAIWQGRRGAYGEQYFENHEIIMRQLEKLDPHWRGSFSLNAGYGNFDDEPGGNSPIAHAAPMHLHLQLHSLFNDRFD